jgi:methionine synthase II (cobalamin-independent)
MKLEGLYRKTTMIGSMPQKTTGEAFELLEKYTLSIPAWPQLPKRSFLEGMIPQYTEGFPGIRIDEAERKIWVESDDSIIDEMTEFYENIVSGNPDAFAMTEKHAAGFHEFKRLFEGKNPKLTYAKGQVTGPYTFGLTLNDQDGKAVWFDDQYRDAVIQGLTSKMLWQIGVLKQCAENVVVFLDEPILSGLGTPAYLGIDDEHVIATFNDFIKAAHDTGTIIGSHCCGNMDWGILLKTDIDIIAFDAYFFGEKLALYSEELIRFLGRGGILAWGIVPTNNVERLRKETVSSIRAAIVKLTDTFINKGVPSDIIKSRIIFTPSCGMGPLPTADSEAVLRLLKEITE